MLRCAALFPPCCCNTVQGLVVATAMRRNSSASGEQRRATARDAFDFSSLGLKEGKERDAVQAARRPFLQGKVEFGWAAPRTPTMSSSSSLHQVPVVMARESWVQRLRMVGMPKGYPHTCAAGFPRYFYLSVSAAFVGNFATSIATQTLLGGFFADSSARVWMLKDLAPAILAAFIANKMVSYEQRPKFWLVVYAVLTNASTITDMFIPSLVPPAYLLPAAVLTSLVKQSALLMFFISRACALQHFATHNNLAEFTKKFNSFGMVIYTVATACGIAFTSFVTTTFETQLAAVLICCCLNTILNCQSMLPIAFRVVNPTTGHIIFRRFVATNFTSVPTPQEVSTILGFRGVVHHEAHEFTDRILIGPALDALIWDGPRAGMMVVAHPELPFGIGVFEVAKLPAAKLNLRFWDLISKPFVSRLSSNDGPRRGDALFETRAQRLVLLVEKSCDSRHLLAASLMVYHAAMQPAHRVPDFPSLLTFLRTDCLEHHKQYLRRADTLIQQLKSEGWDTKNVLVDPLEMRIGCVRSDAAATTGVAC